MAEPYGASFLKCQESNNNGQDPHLVMYSELRNIVALAQKKQKKK
jgi:hypothetical protein